MAATIDMRRLVSSQFQIRFWSKQKDRDTSEGDRSNLQDVSVALKNLRNRGHPRLPYGWLMGASLVLNLALASWLLWTWKPLPAPLPPSESKAPGPTLAKGQGGSKHRPSALREGRATNSPAFHWSQVESADYREYIANLRALGCPEPVIHDLIATDLRQLYSWRSRGVFPRAKREYWQKWRESDNPKPAQVAQLRKMDHERQQVERSLVGSSLRGQEVIDLLFLQVHGTERELVHLPADKRAAATVALERSGFFRDEEVAMEDSAVGSRSGEKALNEKKWKILGEVLTADELKEFRGRQSGEASALRGQLRYFEASQQEFDALLEVRAQLSKDPQASSDYYAREAVHIKAAKQVLGEERGREYERATDLFYTWSRNAATRFGLPEESATEAWQVKREAMAAATRIRGDASFTAEARREELARVQRRAADRLVEILGPKGTRLAQAGDGAWLQTLAESDVP